MGDPLLSGQTARANKSKHVFWMKQIEKDFDQLIVKKLWKSRRLNKPNQMTGIEVTGTNTMFILVFGSLAFPQGLMLNCCKINK